MQHAGKVFDNLERKKDLTDTLLILVKIDVEDVDGEIVLKM